MCHSLPMGLYGTHQPGASQFSDRDNDVIIHLPACRVNVLKDQLMRVSTANKLTYSYHTGSPIWFNWPAAWTASVWEAASWGFFFCPQHTRPAPSSVCSALTSPRAPSKLLYSEVSQIENEGNQMRTTRSSQRRDAESTRSQLKISVCSVFFFVAAGVTSNIPHLYELGLRCLRWDLWRF